MQDVSAYSKEEKRKKKKWIKELYLAIYEICPLKKKKKILRSLLKDPRFNLYLKIKKKKGGGSGG